MQVLGRGRCLYVDVDNTLVAPADGEAFAHAIWIGEARFVPLERNIDTLKRFAANPGTTIVVWSAGGADWAEKVMYALGLPHLVHLCISKPTWYLDDLADAGFAYKEDAWIDAKETA
jgi:hypothetical protein